MPDRSAPRRQFFHRHAIARRPDVSQPGQFLEIVENQRLVWINALAPGFRPAAIPEGGFAVTGIIELADHAQGTQYTATVLHENSAARDQHAAMGFEEGWGKALEQLVAMVESW